MGSAGGRGVGIGTGPAVTIQGRAAHGPAVVVIFFGTKVRGLIEWENVLLAVFVRMMQLCPLLKLQN
jgi:hypothetical protein